MKGPSSGNDPLMETRMASYRTIAEPKATIVRARGELDITSTRDLCKHLIDALARTVPCAIDLRDVSYCPARIVGALLRFTLALEQRTLMHALVLPSAPVARRIIELTDRSALFHGHETLREALVAVGARRAS